MSFCTESLLKHVIVIVRAILHVSYSDHDTCCWLLCWCGVWTIAILLLYDKFCSRDRHSFITYHLNWLRTVFWLVNYLLIAVDNRLCCVTTNWGHIDWTPFPFISYKSRRRMYITPSSLTFRFHLMQLHFSDTMYHYLLLIDSCITAAVFEVFTCVWTYLKLEQLVAQNNFNRNV